MIRNMNTDQYNNFQDMCDEQKKIEKEERKARLRKVIFITDMILLVVFSAIIVFCLINTKKDEVDPDVSNSVENPRIDINNNKVTYDVIEFGSYPQNVSHTDDVSTLDADAYEPIQWYVLSVDDNVATCLAVDCLDVRGFNESDKAVFYLQSSLREWLNNDFSTNAFTAEELSALVPVKPISNKAGESEKKLYEEEGVDDKVTLLTEEELTDVKMGFCAGNKMSGIRTANGTQFAGDEQMQATYWVSDIGEKKSDVIKAGDTKYGGMYIGNSGCLSHNATFYTKKLGVRPVIHVDLSNAEYKKVGSERLEFEISE